MDAALIERAAGLLRAGGVVALPTETVYGLAADATNAEAVARIFAIKGRPREHPLIVHLPDAAALPEYVREVPAAAQTLADRFWPGPLTIVLWKNARIPGAVTGGQETVALRVVDHPLTAAILRAFGGPVGAPSANRFGRVSPTNAAHVRADLGDEVDLIVDGGPAQVGVESTIVDLTGATPAVLRSGAIAPSALADALGRPVVTRSGGSVRVSGSLPAHYAPRTPLVLLAPDAADAETARRRAAGASVARLTLPADPAAAARTLYAALRALDAEGYDAIVAAAPPAGEAWDAVRDRLTRAAAT